MSQREPHIRKNLKVASGSRVEKGEGRVSQGVRMEGGRGLDKASRAIMRGFIFTLQAQESHGRALNRRTAQSVLCFGNATLAVI